MKKSAKQSKTSVLFSVVVKTARGTFVLWGTRRGLYRLEFPRRSVPAAAAAGKAPVYLQRAARRFERYLEGGAPDLRGIPVDFSGYTPFQEKILRALWKSRPGSVESYGSLAARCGHARAARAVGSVMRKNRLPVFVPCHRVLGSQGRLGGYPLGLDWKKRLLDIEKCGV